MNYIKYNNIMEKKLELLACDIFKIKCSVGLDTVNCNIDDIPDYSHIKNNINKLLSKYDLDKFHYDLKFISKDVNENKIDFLKIPNELENEVKSYIGPGFDLPKYIKNIICNKFINELLEIKRWEEFDMIYYVYGSRDYNWAKNTVKDSEEKIMIIKSLMN